MDKSISQSVTKYLLKLSRILNLNELDFTMLYTPTHNNQSTIRVKTSISLWLVNVLT